MKKVREGYKMTDLGEIPVDWVVGKLGDLSEIVRGASPRPKGDPKYYGGSVPRLMISDVTRDGKYVTPKTDFLTEEGAKKSRPMNKGDLVMSISGTVALPSFLAVDSCIHDGFMGFKKIDEQLYKDYLYYEILHLREKLINSATDGGVYINLTTDIVKNFDILVPLMKEQQKISLILSSVDEQIEITDNLIEKTKELKKGLMQKLLTKGIGNSRFKDTEIGRIPEAWEIRGLIDISQGKGEYGIGAVATEYVVGNPRYLRITDIGDESKLLFNDIKGLNDEEYEKYLLKYNDVVFARTGNTTGKSYAYDIKDGELVYAGFLIKFSINPKLANVNFIKYVIQSKRYWDWVNVMSTRSGQPGINSNEYAKFLIQLPGIEEQNQISLILSSVDEQIDQYESKKEKLQELKKGLMQKLLTGCIRVKV
ncbi:restriction endonuclease subunit S [Clostridium saccharobutylicum]|uniref:Type-1 restriction enzyme EcoKI specificity protein n=1 Tax=Clostridium saccharobutylicum TaxID=169679 RepID=A0A1S8MYY4_CLOSA|nr:restriction endonuclease subunit S [Clostridium saccharobutylicum]OOM09436.1 type-1 restriction enzyme EcoKI specificity protein [Clostridium saccharobutylicum]